MFSLILLNSSNFFKISLVFKLVRIDDLSFLFGMVRDFTLELTILDPILELALKAVFILVERET